MPATDNRRVFFALWPDQSLAEQLSRIAVKAQAACGGRLMRPDTLHLTLTFIGSVPVARIDDLRRAASRVQAQAIDFKLDRFGCWRHNGIVWAGASEPPAQLQSLAGQLRAALTEAGLPFDARDFAAHVTLLRNARCAALPELETITWSIEEFVLVESQRQATGATYALVERWPLGAQR